jgi:O-antigen/teichoic acid export membrane protein
MNASLIYFIVRFGNGLLAIATIAVLSRLLTPEQYGKYALLIAAASVLSSLSFQWLSAAISRFYPHYYERPADIMRVASRYFWLATLWLSLLCLIVLGFHKIVEVEPINIVLIFMITIALGRYAISLQIANSQHALMRYCLLSWTKLSVALGASIFFIYFGAGEQGALIGLLLGLGLAIWVFEPHPKIGLTGGMEDAGLSFVMLRFGFPLVLNFLAIVLLDLVDRFMIARLLGIAYVAPYSIAYDFIQLIIGPFLNIFFLSAFPIITYLFDAKKHDAVNDHLKDLGAKLISFGLPLAVLISISSGDIARLLFGVEYQQEASMLMPWLSAAIFVGVFKSYCLDVGFQLHHATQYQSLIAVFMVIVNIILNLMLLPRFGLIAAGWATLGAFLFGAVLSWVIVRKLFHFPSFIDVSCKASLSCFIMALTIYFLSPAFDYFILATKFTLAFFTYILLALFFNLADSRKIMFRIVGWLKR